MKAITVPQPDASLTATGIRTSDVRTRPAPQSLVGQRIGIHSGKAPITHLDLAAWSDETRDAVRRLYPEIFDLDGELRISSVAAALPQGCVVATARLADVGQIITWAEYPGERLICRTPYGAKFDVVNDGLSNYLLDRWVWLFADIESLPEPIPSRGRPGIWEWTPADGSLL